MTWFDKQARARRRAEQERNALAASVEEVVAEGKLVADEWHNEHEEQDVVEHASTSGTAIIPPLLRLQTRPIPAFNAMPSRSDLTTTGPVEVPRVIEQGQRLAGRSTKVHLQAVHPELAEDISTGRMATVEKISLESQTGSMPRVAPESQGRPVSAPPGAGQTGAIPRIMPENQHRSMLPSPSAGQTGSMPRIVSESQTGSLPRVVSAGQGRPLPSSASAQKGSSASSSGSRRNGSVPASAADQERQHPHLPGGRGVINQGQNVVTVPNIAITERSVVTVMLTGNPGPVVVQYVALHPRMGFTVHLSAPTAASTPFNYLIWPF